MGALDGVLARLRSSGRARTAAAAATVAADASGAEVPAAAAEARGPSRGPLAFLRRRGRPAAEPATFDPDLPDPAAEPGVDYQLDARGRLRGGRRRLAIGLQWQPRQADRSLNAQARESTFGGVPVPGLAALFAGGTQVGFGARADGLRPGMTAAATAIPMRLTGDSWIGAFRLEAEDEAAGVAWWLVALRDGMVYEDRLIRDTQEAQDAFLELTEVPGWKARICPAGWDVPGSADIPLGLLLTRRSRGAVLRPHDPKVIWAPRVALLVLLAAVAGGALYYQSYMEEQRRLAEEARRRAEEAARRAALNVAPWVNTPRLDSFIETCAAGMDELLVLPPGWRLSPLVCTMADKAVTVSAEWKRDIGGRASWFLATMADRGINDAVLSPALDSATLSRTLPVAVAERRDEQPLPPAEMERRLRFRLDTLSLEAVLRPGVARSAPVSAAPGAAPWTNHEFQTTTSTLPHAQAGLLADIPGVLASELTYDPYAPSWRLTALIYHPPVARLPGP